MSFKSLHSHITRKCSLYFTRKTGPHFLRGERLVIIRENGEESVHELRLLRRLVCIGRVKLDALILPRLMRRDIPVDWLDVMGRPLGQLLAFQKVEERELPCQETFRDSPRALELARANLLCKFDNCHEIMRRRSGLELPWRERREAIARANDADSLRGMEGIAARMYFSCWQNILHAFQWRGRHAHPAPDPVNMLLSLAYGLIHNRLSSALHSAGLNPRLGFFHVSRGEHNALASDLMEPFRALADTQVLSMIRRQEVKPDEFKIRNGACVCGERQLFARLLLRFEEMFAAEHKFYPFPDNEECRLSFNDALDETAISYIAHINHGSPLFFPRLTPWPAI